MKVGRLTLSDRASTGVYKDKSGPEIERLLQDFFEDQLAFDARILPDDQSEIEGALLSMSEEGCILIVTTGGTGPSARDVTPEATRAVITREMPGFGEIMRMKSYEIVKTAILSRATAGVCGRSLIVNLPGNPRAVGECLPLILPAIVEALDHISGFRPTLKS